MSREPNSITMALLHRALAKASPHDTTSQRDNDSDANTLAEAITWRNKARRQHDAGAYGKMWPTRKDMTNR